jgi:hypothetical protein
MAKFDLSIPRIRATQLSDDAVPAKPHSDGTFARINPPNTPRLLGNLSQQHPTPTFQAYYLAGRPNWQKDLLKGVFQPLSTDTLSQHLLNSDHLLFCSDGGAKDNKGSFGWVIVTSSQLLWECSGIATGWFANSFRSEGIGQLALLVFLDAYITYYQLEDLSAPLEPKDSETWFRIAMDNKDLISRITTGLTSKAVFASAGLRLEYDVVNEILEITRCLALPLTWKHVKGHQDEKRQWCELTHTESSGQTAML